MAHGVLSVFVQLIFFSTLTPGLYKRHSLLSSRHHLSNDDCLEDKREDYQNYSVWYCV